MIIINELKERLDQFFSHRKPEEIAKDLLGHELYYKSPKGLVSGYIVETEAYGGSEDSTSYAARNHITKSSRPLYDIPGTMYIYKIHARYVFGIVNQPKGQPSGIMIRAIEPNHGKNIMEQNRIKHGKELTNGPGKFMEALGVKDENQNLKLCNQGPLGIDLNHKRSIINIQSSARIGVSEGKNKYDQMRFYISGNPYVSKIKKRDTLNNNGWKE